MQYSVALSKPKKKLHHRLEYLLSLAEVAINGNRPWDIRIHNDNFYHRVLKYGSIGLGESYMEGWWDATQVDEFICRVFKSNLQNRVHSLQDIICCLQALFINQQCLKRSYTVGEKHYDIGNGLYERMLDKRMLYTVVVSGRKRKHWTRPRRTSWTWSAANLK